LYYCKYSTPTLQLYFCVLLHFEEEGIQIILSDSKSKTLKPSIYTFLVGLFSIVSIALLGQEIVSVDNPDPQATSIRTEGNTDPGIDINSIKINNFNPPLLANDQGHEEVMDGVTCTTLTYYENDGLVPIQDELSLNDIAGSQMLGAVIHMYHNFRSDQDALVFEDQNGITGAYDPVEGKVTLTGTASKENYEKALASVSYINTSEDPNTERRKVNFYVENEAGITNFERTYIDVVSINDPPFISGSETVLQYAPGSGAVEADTAITIIDVDDSLLRAARVWIAKGYKPSEDLLSVAEAYGISVSWDEGSAHLSLNGYATISEYEEIMSAVTYLNSNPDPEPSRRTVGFKVWDEDIRSNFHYREIEILPVNMPPVIVGEDGNPIDTIYVYTYVNQPVDVCVDVEDPEGNNTTVTSVVSQTGHGSGEDLDSLCFTFMPEYNYIGSDTLTVLTCDDGIPSACDSVIVIAIIEPEPDYTPYIVNTSGSTIDTLYYQTDEDVPLDFCLIVDIPEDVNLDLGTITEAGDSTGHGILGPNDEGPFCFTYQPEENYNGESSWIIKVCNDSIPPGCDSVVVIIDVLPVNDEPVAVNDTVTTIRNDVATGNLTDNDYDIDGDDLIMNTNPEANPMHGSVTLHPDGSFEYTADPGYLGEDRFTYVVCDDGDPSLCAAADVIITIEDVPLKVYNAVSPNGDDLNDFLYIEGIEYYPDNLLSIYDRYNNLVYETLGYNNNNITWQGQANKGLSTRELPGDTYFYILNPGDGLPLLKGFIMLKME